MSYFSYFRGCDVPFPTQFPEVIIDELFGFIHEKIVVLDPLSGLARPWHMVLRTQMLVERRLLEPCVEQNGNA